MTSYSLYQVDAFTDQLFSGNPAAIVPLTHWLDAGTMQLIAAENNLSETAFLVPEGAGFGLRWFTPTHEMDLCGHATLAAAYTLFEYLDYNQPSIRFHTLSGELIVTRCGDNLAMDLPSRPARREILPPAIAAALGAAPQWSGICNNWLLRYSSAAEVAAIAPDFNSLLAASDRNVIVTAPADDSATDFVSRFFAPHVGINEDPVTGSAHCTLTPYWAQELDKTVLAARQISRRGGQLGCELLSDRVRLSGRCKLFMEGTFYV